MEYTDAFSIFMAGVAIGLIGAHHLNKHENKLAYNRGVLDVIWELQRALMLEHLTSRIKPARYKEDGGGDSSKKDAGVAPL